LSLGLCCAVVGWVNPVSGDDAFRNRVAPLLEQNCLRRHNQHERKGGLSLETRAAAIAGGESGPAIAPGDAGSSYLLDLITASAGKAEMPKDAAPLSAEQVAIVRKWIDAGAP
jgi:hypothetical protein